MRTPVSPGEGGGLSAFKDALRREHSAKLALLEKERDDAIADLIAERRRSVETEVSRLRREHEERFRFLAEEMRKDAAAGVRRDLLQEFSRLRSDLEESMRSRCGSIRAQRDGEYGHLLRSFAEEALSRVGRPAVILVEPGEGTLVSGLVHRAPPQGPVEVREELLDGWGGCMVLSGSSVIDNTMKARWERLSPLFSLELSRLMHVYFQDIRKRIAKL